jgi:hypothetical protein
MRCVFSRVSCLFVGFVGNPSASFRDCTLKDTHQKVEPCLRTGWFDARLNNPSGGRGSTYGHCVDTAEACRIKIIVVVRPYSFCLG